jgi:hypothetical protein
MISGHHSLYDPLNMDLDYVFCASVHRIPILMYSCPVSIPSRFGLSLSTNWD